MNLPGALCSKLPPKRALALFFQAENIQAAKDICRRCPVIKPCLDAAIANREHFGVWGGTDEDARAKMSKARIALQR